MILFLTNDRSVRRAPASLPLLRIPMQPTSDIWRIANVVYPFTTTLNSWIAYVTEL